MAVTIRDVAKAAGVSISTVSRALTTPDLVAQPTRDLVLETSRGMGYRPNRAARGLITGRTGCIGLVVPDLENPFFGSIGKGVQDRARAAGYAVFIGDSGEDPTLEAEVVRGIAKQVDGVILCSARGSDESIRALAAETPLVLVNRGIEGLDSINFDNAAGLRAIMQHLLALGHTSIAYAAGPVTSWSNGRRTDAFRAFGEQSPDVRLIELGNFPPVFDGGVQAADLAIASGATAVVAYNDLMALGLIDRLRQRGKSAPEDMSIASFDNVPVSSMVWPKLTSVDFPRIQMGRVCVDTLLDTVLGRPHAVPHTSDLPLELVVRQSTGVVPATAANGLDDTPAAPVAVTTP
ncbi:MAG: LacI family DNA-binding transcriptional regulator [Microbacteriaceae bacterium]